MTDKEAYREVLEAIDAGLCDKCEHQSDGCYKICDKEGYEKETLIKWLKERAEE